MMPGDGMNEAKRLSDYWDALNAETGPANHADVQAFGQTLHRFLSLDDTPLASPELVGATWSRLTGSALPGIQPAMEGHALPSLNGHRPAAALSGARTPGARVSRWSGCAALYRLVAIGVLGGLLAGAVAGVVARLAMRLAGYLTVDRNRAVLTENEAVVGKITGGGTAFIVIAGVAAGLLGGLIYIAVRSWLPFSGWRRSLGYGGGLLVVFGFVIMNPHNPDYRTFGPAWLNVSSFSSIYVVFGFVVSQVVDALDRRIPEMRSATRTRWRSVAIWVGLLPFAALGVGALIVIATSAAGLAGVLALLLVVAAPSVRLYLERHPGVIARFPRPAIARYALIVAPSCLGLFLTVRAIAEILLGG